MPGWTGGVPDGWRTPPVRRGGVPSWGWVLITLGVLVAFAAGVAALGRGGPDVGRIISVTGTPTPVPSPARTPDGWDVTEVDLDAYAAGLVDATNAARRTEGLDPLAASDCARAGAQTRATALVGQEDLEHAPLGPVLDACAGPTVAAENLSRAAAEPPAVVDAWLGSPGHRANVLDPTLDELGVACTVDGDQVLCSAVFLGP
ncbi:CAP domain-containing protein [Cellulomonas sp. NS3]|uniref:CAP domain-containing protein n=1 Tax=Cellulomonas sp. NS3 TaxID=2973977 RepID=UPI0021634645|nr:CAP domain-containing protein [Cellulomonas sp. NS3]